MKVKGKRVLKNGVVAGYVYYTEEKKWKWRFLGRENKSGGCNKKIKDNLKQLHEMGHKNRYYEKKLENLQKGKSEKKIAESLKRHIRKKYRSKNLSKRRKEKKEILNMTIALLEQNNNPVVNQAPIVSNIPKKKLSEREIIRKQCKSAGMAIFNDYVIEYIIGRSNSLNIGTTNYNKAKIDIINKIKHTLDTESKQDIEEMYMLKKKIEEEEQYKEQNNVEYNLVYETFVERLIDMINENKISMCILNTFVDFITIEAGFNNKKYNYIQRKIRNRINKGNRNTYVTFQ